MTTADQLVVEFDVREKTALDCWSTSRDLADDAFSGLPYTLSVQVIYPKNPEKKVRAHAVAIRVMSVVDYEIPS